jgi:hypothetical protein
VSGVPEGMAESVSPNEQLVFKAIDAARRHDDLVKLKRTLPEQLQSYVDITRAYMEKHEAIEACVAKMRE